MNMRFVLAVVIGTVVMFFLGYAIFGILLANFYSAQMTAGATALIKNPPVLWAIALSNLVSVSLVTMIFDCYANIRTLAKGAIVGALISCLFVLSIDLSFYAFMNMFNNVQFIIIDSIINAVFGGIIGGVIGFVLGFGRETATS